MSYCKFIGWLFYLLLCNWPVQPVTWFHLKYFIDFIPSKSSVRKQYCIRVSTMNFFRDLISATVCNTINKALKGKCLNSLELVPCG